MSGPKLIEIRRMRAAQERQRNHDECAGGLAEYARLLGEIQEWVQRCASLGVIVQPELRSLESMRVEAAQRLYGEQHHEAARMVREELQKARDIRRSLPRRFQERVLELQQRHRQLVQEAELLEAERARFLRRMEAAIPPGNREAGIQSLRQAMQLELQKVSVPAPGEIPDSIEAVEKLEQNESLVATAGVALRSAKEHFDRELKSAQRDAIAALGPAVASRSLGEVIQSLSAKAEKSSPDEMDKLISELATMASAGVLQEFRERAATVRGRSDPAQRRLLQETFLIEGGLRLKTLREAAAWQNEAHALINSAAHVTDPGVETILGELREMLRAGGMPDLASMKTRLRAAVARAEATRDREEKRQALLASLKSIGYETSENLETAFVREGRLILRRAGDDEYGVEVVSDRELNQLQTALVRYAASPDVTEQQRRRDRDREESWCSDHTRLREQMAQRGLETAFKMQLEPGEHSVRVIVREGETRPPRTAAGENQGEKR
jgi:hypothetical protein